VSECACTAVHRLLSGCVVYVVCGVCVVSE